MVAVTPEQTLYVTAVVDNVLESEGAARWIAAVGLAELPPPEAVENGETYWTRGNVRYEVEYCGPNTRRREYWWGNVRDLRGGYLSRYALIKEIRVLVNWLQVVRCQ